MSKQPPPTKAKIYYHDIGDYLTREQKLQKVKEYGSFSKLPMTKLHPNEHGDWLSMRNSAFESFIPIEPEKKFDEKSNTFFNTYAIGVATNRDAWTYNFSTESIESNMQKMITFYNEQQLEYRKVKATDTKIKVENFIESEPTKISWTRALRKDVEKGTEHEYKGSEIRFALYRPYVKQKLYFDKSFIESPGLTPRIFPNQILKNKVICVTGSGASKPFSVLISGVIPNLDTLEKAQCFPLYYYEEKPHTQKGLFDTGDSDKHIRREAISDFILARAKQQYGFPPSPSGRAGEGLSKEDIFYYVYGFLHSKAYRETFANDLKKMLPRLPLVEEVKDFWAFSKAGRQLAELHLNYETVAPCPGVVVLYDTMRKKEIESGLSGKDMDAISYEVSKMRFAKKGQNDTILYNNQITIENIPAKAYDYVVNGKSAIEWIMERYALTTHKESGITNDPNDWAKEVGNPRYILDLLLSIINVSVQTVDIVNALPKVDFGSTIKTDVTSPILTTAVRPQNIHAGIYSVQDVAHFMRLSQGQIRTWFDRLQVNNYEGISDDTSRKGQRLMNFYGVFELIVIYDLASYLDEKGKVRQRMKLKEIFDARKWLQVKFKSPYPFAIENIVRQIATAGKKLEFHAPDSDEFLELGKGGNMQMLFPFIEQMLEKITFKDGVVDRIYFNHSRSIAIDPSIGGGRPSTIEKGVNIEMIKSMYKATPDVGFVARQYDIPINVVKEAIDFDAILLAN